MKNCVAETFYYFFLSLVLGLISLLASWMSERRWKELGKRGEWEWERRKWKKRESVWDEWSADKALGNTEINQDKHSNIFFLLFLNSLCTKEFKKSRKSPKSPNIFGIIRGNWQLEHRHRKVVEDVFSYLDVIGKLTEVIERIECETMRLLSRRIVLRLFSEEAATLIQQLRRKAAILST